MRITPVPRSSIRSNICDQTSDKFWSVSRHFALAKRTCHLYLGLHRTFRVFVLGLNGLFTLNFILFPVWFLAGKIHKTEPVNLSAALPRSMYLYHSCHVAINFCYGWVFYLISYYLHALHIYICGQDAACTVGAKLSSSTALIKCREDANSLFTSSTIRYQVLSLG